MNTFYHYLTEKFKQIISKDSDGYDVVDFRIGTIIGTIVLLIIPVFNTIGGDIIPDDVWFRFSLVSIQIFTILASYKLLFIKRWSNYIGNLFSLIYAFLISTVCFQHKFKIEETSVTILIIFALMAMFKEVRTMKYYTLLAGSYFIALVAISENPQVSKNFLVFFSATIWTIGYYTFWLKLKNLDDLAKKEASLRQSEAWFRRIFDNSPMGIALLDAQYNAFKFNKYFQELTGYTESELTVLGMDSIIHKEDFMPLNDYVVYVNSPEIKSLEQRIVTKSGRVIWMRSTTSQMMLDNIAYTIAMYSDVTYEKTSELQMKQFNDQLKLQNAALEEFSYVISHDLQEPLRMITSFSQHIQKRYIKEISDPQANNDFNFVIDGAKRMSQLITDMLEYSRWTAKELPIEILDVREVLAETFQNLTVTLSKTNAEVISGDMPIIIGNRLMIGQVFQNLVGNAIRYAHPDRTPIVEIDIEKRESDILFIIKDNGIGIDDTDKDRVFGIFQRLNPSKSEGTGMGLAICKRIIERQGGKIWFESELHEGTTFFFSLPNHDETKLDFYVKGGKPKEESYSFLSSSEASSLAN